MSIFNVKYKVKNSETGKMITKVKWRVQIRTKSLKVNKLFDTYEEALNFEKQAHDENSDIKKGIKDFKHIIDTANKIDIKHLLKTHYNSYLKHLSESTIQTNKNRCLSSIPNITIDYMLIQKNINKYTLKNDILNSFLDNTFDIKNGIKFGDFIIDEVDVNLIIAYIETRKNNGIANNTILRELGLISGAFERVYKYYPDVYNDGLINPVHKLPRGEKPKPYNGRKRILNDEESFKIAEWLKLKNNKEPYYLFIQCLYSGARKSEILNIKYENINYETKTALLLNTKNKESRTIQLEDEFFNYLTNNKKSAGKVLKLSAWNFRQYWVEALKVLNMYDDNRPFFHDTRRTAITRNIKQLSNNSFTLAKSFGVSPKEIEKQKNIIQNNSEEIINKLKRGERLTEIEIMVLFGHKDINTTQIYNADRN